MHRRRFFFAAMTACLINACGHPNGFSRVRSGGSINNGATGPISNLLSCTGLVDKAPIDFVIRQMAAVESIQGRLKLDGQPVYMACRHIEANITAKLGHAKLLWQCTELDADNNAYGLDIYKSRGKTSILADLWRDQTPPSPPRKLATLTCQ